MALTINMLYKGEKGNLSMTVKRFTDTSPIPEKPTNISSGHKTNNKTKNAPLSVRFVFIKLFFVVLVFFRS